MIKSLLNVGLWGLLVLSNTVFAIMIYKIWPTSNLWPPWLKWANLICLPCK